MAIYPPLVYSSEIDQDELTRARDRGGLARLATGIYTSEADKPVEEVAKRRLWQIVAHVMPDAVIVDRSARDGGTGADGTLHVVSKRRRVLALPGIKVIPRVGVGPQPGDMLLADGLYMSGHARGLLENLAPTRKAADGSSRTLPREEVEIWINELAARGGGFLNGSATRPTAWSKLSAQRRRCPSWTRSSALRS